MHPSVSIIPSFLSIHFYSSRPFVTGFKFIPQIQATCCTDMFSIFILVHYSLQCLNVWYLRTVEQFHTYIEKIPLLKKGWRILKEGPHKNRRRQLVLIMHKILLLDCDWVCSCPIVWYFGLGVRQAMSGEFHVLCNGYVTLEVKRFHAMIIGDWNIWFAWDYTRRWIEMKWAVKILYFLMVLCLKLNIRRKSTCQ